jgi:hypothetical protein
MSRSTIAAGLLPAFVALATAVIAQASDGFDLITQDEFAREQSALSAAASKSVPTDDPTADPTVERSLEGPSIEVVSPDTQETVRSPVDIDLKFEPGPGAVIQLDSLRIRYGIVGLDITERIRQAATINSNGIRAIGAKLPIGDHSMTVEIGDSAGRKAKKKFKVRIVE